MMNGTLSIIFVSLSFILGITLIINYFKHKNINLMLAGYSWMVISEPWWAVSLSFITTITIGRSLPLALFFIIGFILLPTGIQAWITIMTNLVFSKNKNKIRLIFGILNITFEIIFLVLYSLDLSLLGSVVGTFDVMYSSYMLFYLVVMLVIILITGTRFAYESFKSKNKEIKLKGRFLILAFYSYVIGSFVSVGSMDSLIILIVAKIIIISSAIEFYLGFVLPEFVKKIFIRNEKKENTND